MGTDNGAFENMKGIRTADFFQVINEPGAVHRFKYPAAKGSCRQDSRKCCCFSSKLLIYLHDQITDGMNGNGGGGHGKRYCGDMGLR